MLPLPTDHVINGCAMFGMLLPLLNMDNAT